MPRWVPSGSSCGGHVLPAMWAGNPCDVVVAPANRNGMKVLADTLDAVMVERPTPTPEEPQHLCADKGGDFDACDSMPVRGSRWAQLSAAHPLAW